MSQKSQQSIVLTPDQCKSEFKKVFKSLGQKHNFAEAWADLCEVFAITIHQSSYFHPQWEELENAAQGEQQLTCWEKIRANTLPADDEFHRLEETYMTFVPKYGREGMMVMTKLYGLAEHYLRCFRIDFLGILYEEMEIVGASQRSSRGEFFTPYPISKLMAQMTLSNLESAIENRGYVTCHEPCSGAGGMIIAVAEVMEQQGYDPRVMLLAECIDINRTFFNITYFQLSALDLPARVWHGNTLSLKFQDFRETPQLKLSRFHHEKNPIYQMLKLLKTLESPADATTSEVIKDDNQEVEELTPTEPSIPLPTFEADDRGQFQLF